MRPGEPWIFIEICKTKAMVSWACLVSNNKSAGGFISFITSPQHYKSCLNFQQEMHPRVIIGTQRCSCSCKRFFKSRTFQNSTGNVSCTQSLLYCVSFSCHCQTHETLAVRTACCGQAAEAIQDMEWHILQTQITVSILACLWQQCIEEAVVYVFRYCHVF